MILLEFMLMYVVHIPFIPERCIQDNQVGREVVDERDMKAAAAAILTDARSVYLTGQGCDRSGEKYRLNL